MRWGCFCSKILNLVSRQGALNSSNMTLTLEGPGLTLALVSIILLVLSWVTVVGRLIVRRKIDAVGTDDWFMVAGLVSRPTIRHTYFIAYVLTESVDTVHPRMSGNHICCIQWCWGTR